MSSCKPLAVVGNIQLSGSQAIQGTLPPYKGTPGGGWVNPPPPPPPPGQKLKQNTATSKIKTSKTSTSKKPEVPINNICSPGYNLHVGESK